MKLVELGFLWLGKEEGGWGARECGPDPGRYA